MLFIESVMIYSWSQLRYVHESVTLYSDTSRRNAAGMENIRSTLLRDPSLALMHVNG